MLVDRSLDGRVGRIGIHFRDIGFSFLLRTNCALRQNVAMRLRLWLRLTVDSPRRGQCSLMPPSWRRFAAPHTSLD